MRKYKSLKNSQRINIFRFLILLLFLGLGIGSIYAEGIKELANGTTSYPITSFGSNGWADPGAPDNLKLFIYIEDPTSESIYLGFSSSGEDYEIFDPNGTLVYSNTSNGNASNVAEAIVGPTQVVGAGGYTAQVFTLPPGSPAGNYYIEFDGSANNDYWDISVAKAGNSYTEIGRVWSMIWWFNMGGWTSTDAFEATLFAYSTEGFVSKVNYAGSNFRPFVFSVYYNANGPGSSGNLEEDRKSVNNANAGTASFPVFLNPPPEEIMPSASFGDLVGVPTITRTAASGPNKFSFNLSSTQPGTFRILLNVYNNTTPDYFDDVVNTTDRVLVFDVDPAPGETPPYVRALPWDGLDGNGNTLADGYNLHFTVGYADGRSHFPTYDAEYLADGLDVSQVRPSNAYDIQLFWDDSNIPDDPNTSTHADFIDGTTGYNLEMNGADPPAHTWVNTAYGDNNTINTWWYCSLKQDIERTIPLPAVAGSAPTIQATDITFSEVGNTAMKVKWTNGNGVRRAVFMSTATTGQPYPIDATSYTASSVFGDGDEIGPGWFCVYNDAASPQVVVTGLTQDTEYRVMVFEYNNGGGIEYYNTSTATGNPANESTIIIDQATNVNFTSVLSNSFTVNWTNGTGPRRAAFIKLTSVAGDALPVNNVTYNASTVYGVGDPIEGTQWYCIYDGTGSSVDVSNLAKNTDYTVMVCEYFGSVGNENYVTVTNATDPNNQVTLAESPAHHIVFSSITTNSMQIGWTNGDGIARQVFVKQTSSTSDEPAPVDGISYAANTTFGSGEQLGTTGWYCVYEGSASTVSISGLAPSTDYRVKVCDYTGAHNYIVGSIPTNPLTQATYGVTPTVQAHDITFPNTGAIQMDINWVNGNGTRRAVFASQTETGEPIPVDGTNYNANEGFELGSQIGSSGWYCIYNGTGTSVTMTNILEATIYRFMVCEYNQDATGPLYNTSTAVLNPQNDTSLTAGITVSAISQNTTEGGQTATFSIVLNTQPTADVTIGLSSDDTGEGTIAITGVTFNSSNWNVPQVVIVSGQDDAVYDGDITYNIITAAATSSDIKYDAMNPDDVEVINEDNESLPSITINNPSVAEGNSGTTTLTYTISLSGISASDVTLDWATADGSATAGSDYVAVTSTQATITAGNTTVDVDVTVNGDVVLEGDETILVNLSNPSGATISDNQGSGTITDDEAALTLSINNPSVAEGNSGTTTLTYTISLSGISASDVTLDWATADGSATAGSDYVAVTSTQATITAGNTTVDVDVTVNGDVVLEGDETILVNLSNPSGATISDNQGSGTITDDEAALTLSINDPSVTEGNSGTTTLTYTITLSGISASDVTLDWATADGSATAGSDYVAVTSTQATITAGNTTVDVDVTVNGDVVLEGDETILVNLSNPSGATISDNQGSGTITDDEAALTLSINDPSVAEGDAGTTTLTYTISLSGISASDVTLDWATADGSATAGSDYVAVTSTQATITAGNTTVDVDVTVNGDVVLEGDETILVNLSNPSGATISDNQGSGTITDDEVALTLSINDPSVAEGDAGTTTLTYTISLSGISASDVTLDWATADGSATAGSDYVAVTSTQATITAGNTTVDVDVTVNGDVVLEGDETILVNLSNPSGATISDNQGSGTITDDEAALTLSINNPSVAEGNSGTTTLTYTISLSGISASDVTLDWATADGSATAGNDYVAVTSTQATITAGNTTVDVDVTVNGDVVLEGDETILVNLSNPSGATISDNQGSGTITDDEGVPTVTLSVDLNTIIEDAGVSVLTATLNHPTTSDVTVTLAYSGTATGSGTDYTVASTTILIAAGDLTGTATITSEDDILNEGDETVIVDIESVSNALESGTEQVTITITDDEINSSPVASNDTATISEGGTATGNLLDNDNDPDGNSLTVTTTPVSGPSNGTVVINSDGTYSYTPDTDFVGTDSFTYEVCDNGIPSKCASATVTITINTKDTDGDGIPDEIEGTDDPDNDGIPSNEDLDSDGDGIPDEIEGTDDTDNDGIPDYKDEDSDGDGIPDEVEGTDDIDKDGDSNYRDTDSDDDGILDSDEATGDCDNDGISNAYDPDVCLGTEIFIPEGFSPNNDGENDYFEIPEIAQFDHVSIKIFNRWGNIIFEADNYENNWDGTSNVNFSIGSELPTGTYFYQLIIHDTDEIITGYVYLNR